MGETEKLPEGIDSWCQICGVAPGDDCVYANDRPDEGIKRGDPRPSLHFYRGGLAHEPAVLIPDEPPFRDETKWQRERLAWVRGLSDADLQRVVERVNDRGYVDENEGDREERRQAIKWLLSRGRKGDDWGIPAAHAEKLGLWDG